MYAKYKEKHEKIQKIFARVTKIILMFIIIQSIFSIITLSILFNNLYKMVQENLNYIIKHIDKPILYKQRFTYSANFFMDTMEKHT